MQHNLYDCDKNSQALKNHTKFREYLTNNPDVMEEYTTLKYKLAAVPGCTLAQYSAGKTTFITGVLLKAGLKTEEINRIKKENS